MNKLESHRRGDHVILHIPKNASTYMKKNLRLWGGWNPCRLSDVNWQQDKVVGVMQNPLRRWTKGMAEELWRSPQLLSWARQDSRTFFDLQKDTVGDHGAPVTLFLGQRAGQVRWMLMDHAQITLHRQIEMWLEAQGESHLPIEEKIHQSEQEKELLHKWVERQVKNLITPSMDEHGAKNGIILTNYQLLLHQDIEIYRRARQAINPQAHRWNELHGQPVR